MPVVTQFWVFLVAALLAGTVLGVFLARLMSKRHVHYSDVRWKRRYSEMQAEHELTISKLKKTLRHSQDKQANLRQALHESDETLQLLSADDSSLQNQELSERNHRIAELEKKLSHTRAKLADAEDQEATLEKQIAGLGSKLHEVETRIAELETLNAEMKPAHQTRVDQEERYANLQIGLEAAQNKLALQNNEIADMTRQLQKYEAEAPNYLQQINQRDSRLASLNEQFEEMRQQLPTLNDALREREASIDDLIAELAQERQRGQALKEKLAEKDAAENNDDDNVGSRVVSIHRHLRTDKFAGHLQSVTDDEAAEQQVARLERELQQWKQKYESARNEGDDLKLIRGIGPVLETALNEMGFCQFEQLAQMTEQDIEQLARHDSSLPGRVRRYKWVEQARQLQGSIPSEQQRPGV